jgi:hypothetical protein
VSYSLQWLPLLPGWAILLAAAAFLVLLVIGAGMLRRRQVPRRWITSLAVLRIAILTVFVVMLLRPVVTFTREVEQQPELAVLIDTSEGANLEEARQRLQGELGDTLKGRFKVRFYAVGEAAIPVEENQFAGLKPSGSPRLADSLTAANDFIIASGMAPDRVLLVSPGRDVGAEDPASAARRLGLRVDVLPPKPQAQSASEVAIADVQAEPRVLLGSETHVRVTLRAAHSRGLPAPVRLRLTEDGKEVGLVEVAFPSGTSEQRATISHRPGAPGFHRYELTIDRPDSRPYGFTAQVTDGKSEVLVLEDTWRWEFKYLRRVFETDPSYRFTAILPRGSGAVVQFGAPDRRARLVGFPQTRADLEDFDVLVLGDVNVRKWQAALAPAIANAVREGGKSLVVVAGPNLGQIANAAELHALLPVELSPDSGSPVVGPIAVRISTDGRDSPFAVRSADGLPELDQVYLPVRKRPGATVLLEAPAAPVGGRPGIVMAEHTAGRGRVLFIGTDTLWKWQSQSESDRAGATPYSRFWQQALRALTPVRPLRPGVHIWVQSEQGRGRVGRRVLLRAEIDSTHSLSRPSVKAVVEVPERGPLPVEFTPTPGDDAILRAEFTPPRPGAYRVRTVLSEAGTPVAESVTVIDADPADPADAGVDRAALERLASSTGGVVVDPNDPNTWPAPNAESRAPARRARTIDLWENFSLLVLLCILLGIDWGIRLRRGYA